MATTVPGPTTPAGRTHGYLHTALALAVAVLVAAVALNTRQPPPPEIAEFAPQAVEQIKDAPKNQTSDYGSGEGDCPAGATSCEQGQGAGPTGHGAGPTSSTTAAAVIAPIDKARAHKCVGNPPRQIEDPQSPPCVAYWDNSSGNGGATSPGVTADSILVTIDDDEIAKAQIYANFINARFELYGRKLIVVSDGPSSGGRERAANAKEKGAFATLGYQDIKSIFDELAKDKIIGISKQANFTDAELARYAPYIWEYPASATQQLEGIADWACARLAGRNAEFAGTSTPGFGGGTTPVDIKTQPRKFAAYLQRVDPDSAVTIDILDKALQRCGAKLEYSQSFDTGKGDDYWANEAVKLKSRGVTTVISLMQGYPFFEALQREAQTQGYYPEWLMTSMPHYQPGFYGEGPTRGTNRDELSHTMALFYLPMDRVTTDLPNRWAIEGGGSRWGAFDDGSGTQPSGPVYHQMLLLASGIQMAGPRLTPQTFMDGLHHAKFPNPDLPAIKAGKVGFDDGDFAMTDDAIEAWWDPDGDGPYSDETAGVGTFCYDVVDGRRKAGQWPKTTPRFWDFANCDDGTRPVA